MAGLHGLEYPLAPTKAQIRATLALDRAHHRNARKRRFDFMDWELNDIKMYELAHLFDPKHPDFGSHPMLKYTNSAEPSVSRRWKRGVLVPIGPKQRDPNSDG